MGGGISSIPMQIDKETFRKLSGGSLNDAIFDANSVAGIMVLFYLIILNFRSYKLNFKDKGQTNRTFKCYGLLLFTRVG